MGIGNDINGNEDTFNEPRGLTGIAEKPSDYTGFEPSRAFSYSAGYDTPLANIAQSSNSPQNKSNDIDLGFKAIKNPSLGERFQNQLRGGSDREYIQGYRAQQAVPMITKLTSEIGKARAAGDLDRADQLILGLSQMGVYLPHAMEMAKRYATDNAEARKNQEGVDAIVGSMDIAALAKDNIHAATDIMNYSKQGARNPEGLKTVLGANELNISKSGQIVSSSNKTYGTFTERVMPPNVEAKDFTKEKLAAIQQLRLNPNTIASIENKIARNTASPEEKDLYESILAGPQGLTARTAKNTQMGYISPLAGVEANLAPGRGEELTSPTQPNAPRSNPVTSTPLPTTRPGTKPLSKAEQNLNKNINIESTVENVAKDLLARGQAQTIEEARILAPETMRKYIPDLSPEQKAKLDVIEGKANEEYQKTKATNKANYENKSYEQGTGYQMRDGKLIEAPPGLSEKQLADGKWHKEANATDERKQLFNYSKFDSVYEKLIPQIASNPVFDDENNWKSFITATSDYIQKGIRIPGTNAIIGGFGGSISNPDRLKLNAALGAMNQLIEATTNPANKANSEIAAIKNILSSPLSSRKDILDQLRIVHDKAQADAEGIVGVTEGAVQHTERKVPTIEKGPAPLGEAADTEGPRVYPFGNVLRGPQPISPTPELKSRGNVSEGTPNFDTLDIGEGVYKSIPPDTTQAPNLPEAPFTRLEPSVNPSIPPRYEPKIHPDVQVGRYPTVPSSLDYKNQATSSEYEDALSRRNRSNSVLSLNIPLGNKTIYKIFNTKNSGYMEIPYRKSK